MNLDFTEAQELLRRTARSFLEKECDSKLVREMERDEKGYSPEMWRKMAGLGWLGLTLPEEYGGAGGGLLDLVVLYEEMGRVLCPSPHLTTVVLCGGAIKAAGSPEQKQKLLPKIASGELIGAFALSESSGSWQADGVKMTAEMDGNGFVLNGTKLFVQNAGQADFLIVVTMTKDTADKERGITLFLVDAKSDGITYTPLLTMAGDKQAEVVFDNVRVPSEDMVGELHKGWPTVNKVVEEGVVALCAQMIGGCDKVLEFTNEYAKTRVQFDRPIGSFQAIQHYLADIATEISGAKTLMYQAAWAIDERLPTAKVVAMTKVFVGDTYRHVTAVGHQIGGGIAYTVEADMELYSRRAKTAQLMMGTTESWEEVVAQELGL